ncbi:hypothetical protein [Methanococcoides alaskense]|uniref:Uncharacterized protein n=1 Tax=Methanococcoides alaskense TaxID=325778 RepID=A0AA90U249_9EURY|nr:hypothetical protein [Methanococcoides alaskense]MDR6223809.1 hypothetical protein [Methanococcoides alaskense]
MKRVKLVVVLFMVVAMLASIPAAMGHENGGDGFTDVKPGSDPNPINLNSQGLVSIALGGYNGVDGTNLSTINLTTLQVHFDTNGSPEAFVPVLRYSFEDVVNASTPTVPGNVTPVSGADGYMDLVVKVEVQALVDAGLWKPDDGVLAMNLVYDLNSGEFVESPDDQVRIIDNTNMGQANANAVKKNKNK